MDRRTAGMRLSFVALAFVVLVLASHPSGANAADNKAKAKPAAKATPVVSTLPAGTKLDSRALARLIDEAIDARLFARTGPSSPRCDDAEFLRRVYLDITGHIPSADKAAAFLDNRDPNKRAKLIDELLASKDYGKHQADIWQGLLAAAHLRQSRRPVRQDDGVARRELQRATNRGTRWSATSSPPSGDMDKNGAVTYFLANATPDKLTDNATRMFLGVQLQCAQCHNHPFTDWKQNEYWGMAAFFTKVRIDGNPRQAVRRAAPSASARAARAGRSVCPFGQDACRRSSCKASSRSSSAGDALSSGAGRLDDQRQEPLLQQGDGQSRLGAVLRPGHRQSGR